MTRRRFEGGLTIESAIILPMVIICVVFILSAARTVYIRQQMYSGLLKTAHRMAVEAYVLDRTGLADSQQKMYRQGMSAIGLDRVEAQEEADALEGLIGSYRQEAVQLLTFEGRVTEFGCALSELKASDDYSSFAEGAIEAVSDGHDLAYEAGQQIDRMLRGLDSLRNSVLTHYSEAAAGLGIYYANGVLSELTARKAFVESVGRQRLSGWGLSGSGGDLDFKGSESMMVDDTVNLSLVYDVRGLFGDYLGRSAEPVLQKVKVRAWTGSYDSEDIKLIQPEDQPEPIYYVSTLSHDVNCYHVYSCLRKPLTAGTYHEEIEVAGREVCQYCSRHYKVTGSEMPVYFTSDEGKIHLNPMCPLVYAQRVRAVTKDQAEAEGYYPCSKPGCAADHEARREAEGGH